MERKTNAPHKSKNENKYNENNDIDTHLVKLSGPLNVGREEDAVHFFMRLYEQGIERVVIDLEDVPFIDGRGLRALLAGYAIFGGDGRNFLLASPQVQHRLLFELTGFDEVFRVFESVADAMPTHTMQAAIPWSTRQVRTCA